MVTVLLEARRCFACRGGRLGASCRWLLWWQCGHVESPSYNGRRGTASRTSPPAGDVRWLLRADRDRWAGCGCARSVGQRWAGGVLPRSLANVLHPRAYQQHPNGGYAPTKLLLLLRKGASAAVIVPSFERHRVSFLFDRSKVTPGEIVPVSYGAPATVLLDCDTHTKSDWIQYPGAFIVAGAQCATITLVPLTPGTRRQSGAATHVAIPFGRAGCG